MALDPGTRLGAYEVVSPLGAGGMGEVYRARHLKLEREVAIKVLPGELASDPDRLHRFEREARAASALNHPNIVTIHDIDEQEGTRYIAMELVRGRTLPAMLPD
jgi:serine/threonine protein kinase